jgi:hypothetical protein
MLRLDNNIVNISTFLPFINLIYHLYFFQGIFGNAPTEKYFDLTGSATFVTLILASIYMNDTNNLSERLITFTSNITLTYKMKIHAD